MPPLDLKIASLEGGKNKIKTVPIRDLKRENDVYKT
jgi:hypothetical protein